MTAISLTAVAKSVGATGALVVDPAYYPINVAVIFDYAVGGTAVVQILAARGGERWCDSEFGTLTANTSVFITSPVPALRLNVTQLTAGQLQLSVTGADDGSINIPTILVSEDGGYLLDDTTGLPLLAEQT